ncbi:MAG: GNAT family N-acetyltransferase [Pseudomonadota bacterium]
MIHEGYVAGLLGWCVAEHGRYYAREWGFGPFFESKVAMDMADFVRRADQPGNHIWWAGDETPVATLTLDGSDTRDGLVHLRWFIASAAARGQGFGHAMMTRALDAARSDGAGGIYLTTFAGLDAARHLYEAHGFGLVHEAEDTTWGTPVREQLFEMRF